MTKNLDSKQAQMLAIGGGFLVLILAIAGIVLTQPIKDKGVYGICMDYIYKTDKACRCVAKNARSAFPEITYREGKMFTERYFMEADKVDARNKLYLEAELPCKPLHIREACFNSIPEHKRRLYGGDKATHKLCQCTAKEMSGQVSDIYAELKDTLVYYYTSDWNRQKRWQFTNGAKDVLMKYDDIAATNCNKPDV